MKRELKLLIKQISKAKAENKNFEEFIDSNQPFFIWENGIKKNIQNKLKLEIKKGILKKISEYNFNHKSIYLKDFLKNNILFKKYPELKKIKIKSVIYDRDKDGMSTVIAKDKNKNTHKIVRFEIGNFPKSKIIQGIRHELQHYTQYKAKMAGGTSIEEIEKSWDALMKGLFKKNNLESLTDEERDILMDSYLMYRNNLGEAEAFGNTMRTYDLNKRQKLWNNIIGKNTYWYFNKNGNIKLKKVEISNISQLEQLWNKI